MYGGYIDTPIDERDYSICMAFDDSEEIEIPKNYRTSFQPPYANQGSTGNCVAQTIANIMEVIYHKYTGKHKDFSVGFVYGNRYDGDKTSGMTGYQACGTLIKDGDIFSETFDDPGEVPGIIKKVTKFKEENPDWKKDSFIPLFYIRTKNTKDVKKFIMKYDIPVMAVVKVSKFWISFGDDGYHAMPIYGWDDDTAIMQNSWGEDHRANTVELDFDDIKEFWLIVPYSIKEFPDLDKARWSYSGIMRCVEAGIMQGYPDGTIKPEGNITRAEMMALLYRMDKLGI